MMYLTYDKYKSMGGTLDETSYMDLYWDVKSIIDYFTFNRLKAEFEPFEELERCVYRLIQLALEKSKAIASSEDSETSNKAIASMSNDGVSVSYSILSASELLTNYKQDMDDCVKRYLSGVTTKDGRALVYRGLYPGE